MTENKACAEGEACTDSDAHKARTSYVDRVADVANEAFQMSNANRGNLRAVVARVQRLERRGESANARSSHDESIQFVDCEFYISPAGEDTSWSEAQILDDMIGAIKDHAARHTEAESAPRPTRIRLEMSRPTAVAIAKAHALNWADKPDAPAYLREVKSDPSWLPHAWVVDAVLEGANNRNRAQVWEHAEGEIGTRACEAPAAAHSRIAALTQQLATAVSQRDAAASLHNRTEAARLQVVQDHNALQEELQRAKVRMAELESAIDVRYGGALKIAEQQIAGLREELAKANSSIESLVATNTKLTETLATPSKLEQDLHQRLKVTLDQLDKFTSVVADQSIQIMELRGEVKRLTEIASVADGDRAPLAADLQLWTERVAELQREIDRAAPIFEALEIWKRDFIGQPIGYEQALVTAYAFWLSENERSADGEDR